MVLNVVLQVPEDHLADDEEKKDGDAVVPYRTSLQPSWAELGSRQILWDNSACFRLVFVSPFF